jgi:formate hydrogenlyase subunit 4
MLTDDAGGDKGLSGFNNMLEMDRWYFFEFPSKTRGLAHLLHHLRQWVLFTLFHTVWLPDQIPGNPITH